MGVKIRVKQAFSAFGEDYAAGQILDVEKGDLSNWPKAQRNVALRNRFANDFVEYDLERDPVEAMFASGDDAAQISAEEQAQRDRLFESENDRGLRTASKKQMQMSDGEVIERDQLFGTNDPNAVSAEEMLFLRERRAQQEAERLRAAEAEGGVTETNPVETSKAVGNGTVGGTPAPKGGRNSTPAEAKGDVTAPAKGTASELGSVKGSPATGFSLDADKK